MSERRVPAEGEVWWSPSNETALLVTTGAQDTAAVGIDGPHLGYVFAPRWTASASLEFAAESPADYFANKEHIMSKTTKSLRIPRRGEVWRWRDEGEPDAFLLIGWSGRGAVEGTVVDTVDPDPEAAALVIATVCEEIPLAELEFAADSLAQYFARKGE